MKTDDVLTFDYYKAFAFDEVYIHPVFEGVEQEEATWASENGVRPICAFLVAFLVRPFYLVPLFDLFFLGAYLVSYELHACGSIQMDF
jgi:hypothetical protein